MCSTPGLVAVRSAEILQAQVRKCNLWLSIRVRPRSTYPWATWTRDGLIWMAFWTSTQAFRVFIDSNFELEERVD